ncbi:MAG: SWEET family sugar transporter [Methanobrevibacter sp.]|jgi:uncharacterized protein with PQ loop repeat|nr:SWEET family sugar transporter [Candidatus Methanovirga australis]
MEFSALVELIGFSASIFAIFLNLAMLLQIRDMWNSQTHEGINPIMILFMFFNSFFWALYGFFQQDWFMIIPNTLGTIFTPIVLFLIVYFAHKKYVNKKMCKELIEKEIEKNSK